MLANKTWTIEYAVDIKEQITSTRLYAIKKTTVKSMAEHMNKKGNVGGSEKN